MIAVDQKQHRADTISAIARSIRSSVIRGPSPAQAVCRKYDEERTAQTAMAIETIDASRAQAPKQAIKPETKQTAYESPRRYR